MFGVQHNFQQEQLVQVGFDHLPLDVLRYLFSRFLLPHEKLPLSFVCKKFASLDLFGGVRRDRKFAQEALNKAACDGHLSLVKWLQANGYPWDVLACSWAAAGGHLEHLRVE